MTKEGKVSGLSWNDLIKDPKTISVEMLWKLFSKSTMSNIPENSVQYKESRKCFYVGFIECNKLFTDMAVELPEDLACEVLTKVTKETNEFFEAELAHLIPKRDPNKLMG